MINQINATIDYVVNNGRKYKDSDSAFSRNQKWPL